MMANLRKKLACFERENNQAHEADLISICSTKLMKIETLVESVGI